MEGVSKYCTISMCIVVFVVVTTVPNLSTAHVVPEFGPDSGLGSKSCPSSSSNIALTDKQEKQIVQAKQSGVIEKLSSDTTALYMRTEPIVTDFTDYQKKAIACKHGEMIQTTKNKNEDENMNMNMNMNMYSDHARICPAHDIQSLLVFAMNTNNHMVQIVQIHPDCNQIVIQQPCSADSSPHGITTDGSPIHCMSENRTVPIVAVQFTDDGEVTGIGIEFIIVESCTSRLIV